MSRETGNKHLGPEQIKSAHECSRDDFTDQESWAPTNPSLKTSASENQLLATGNIVSLLPCSSCSMSLVASKASSVNPNAAGTLMSPVSSSPWSPNLVPWSWADPHCYMSSDFWLLPGRLKRAEAILPVESCCGKSITSIPLPCACVQEVIDADRDWEERESDTASQSFLLLPSSSLPWLDKPLIVKLEQQAPNASFLLVFQIYKKQPLTIKKALLTKYNQTIHRIYQYLFCSSSFCCSCSGPTFHLWILAQISAMD